MQVSEVLFLKIIKETKISLLLFGIICLIGSRILKLKLEIEAMESIKIVKTRRVYVYEDGTYEILKGDEHPINTNKLFIFKIVWIPVDIEEGSDEFLKYIDVY